MTIRFEEHVNRFANEFFDDSPKYAIVLDVFDWLMFEADFKHILQHIADEGGGYGCEEWGYMTSTDFEDEWDEEDEDYFEDGVMFYELDHSIVIDYPMFVKCLQLACKIYMEEFGEDEEIKKNLKIIEERYADK